MDESNQFEESPAAQHPDAVPMHDDGLPTEPVAQDPAGEAEVAGPTSSSDVEPDGSDRSLVGQGALPLDVRTGDPRVDEAVATLRDLDQLPVAEHAEVFTQVHRDLQDALLSLDQD